MSHHNRNRRQVRQQGNDMNNRRFPQVPAGQSADNFLIPSAKAEQQKPELAMLMAFFYEIRAMADFSLIIDKGHGCTPLFQIGADALDAIVFMIGEHAKANHPDIKRMQEEQEAIGGEGPVFRVVLCSVTMLGQCMAVRPKEPVVKAEGGV